jgi:hypothetical protein
MGEINNLHYAPYQSQTDTDHCIDSAEEYSIHEKLDNVQKHTTLGQITLIIQAGHRKYLRQPFWLSIEDRLFLNRQIASPHQVI